MFFYHLQNLRPPYLGIYQENSSKLINLGTEKATAIDAFYRELDNIRHKIDGLIDPNKKDGSINTGQTRGMIQTYQRACSLAIDAIEKLEPFALDALQPSRQTLVELKENLRQASEGKKLGS